MLQTEAEVEVLNIQINADGVDDTKTSIGDLSTALKTLKELGNIAKPKAIEPPPGFTKLLKKVDGIRKVSRSLNSLRKSLTAYQEVDSKGFSKIFTTMHSELPKLDGIKNATSMSKLFRQINRLPQVLEQFNSLELDGFKNATSEIRKMVDAMKELNDIPNLKDFISSVKKLSKMKAEQGGVKVSPEIPDAPDLSSKLAENAGLVERLKNKFGELKNTIVTTMPKSVAALSWFGGKVKNVLGKVGSVVKKVGAKIKSMIVYRALGSMVSFVTKSLKEGVSNLYQYSKVSNGVFSQNMDKIASSTMYVKNAFGSLLGALIQKAAPYMEYIMDKIGDCINGIRKFYAELTGAQSWTKAKKIPVEFAEATENAVDSTEKLKRSILGFDKLNILDFGSQLEKAAKAKAPSKPKYSTMFEEVTVNVDDKGKLSKTRERVKGLKDSFSDLIGELGRTKDQLFTKENRENFLNNSVDLANELIKALKDIGKLLNDLKIPKLFVEGINGLIKGSTYLIHDLRQIGYIIRHPIKFANTYGNPEWRKKHPKEYAEWAGTNPEEMAKLESYWGNFTGNYETIVELKARLDQVTGNRLFNDKELYHSYSKLENGLFNSADSNTIDSAFSELKEILVRRGYREVLNGLKINGKSATLPSQGKTVAKVEQSKPIRTTQSTPTKQGGVREEPSSSFFRKIMNPSDVSPSGAVTVETNVNLASTNFKDILTRDDLKWNPA